MNLQLIKIKRQNAFDYNLLSEFMTKKNGKLIFNAGFGHAGGGGDNNQKGKLNLMQKFERKFQMQSILKSYNEAFHLHPKSVNNHSKRRKNIDTLTLPYLDKGKENKNSKFMQYKNKRLIKTSNRVFVYNAPFDGKSAKISSKNNYNKEPLDLNDGNTVDYNNYFYHTVDSFPQGTTSENCEKDFYNNSTSYNNLHTENKKRKLLKNMSQDCIYLFGQNKIIMMNKNEKNKYPNTLSQNYDNTKTPFIDYDSDFNPKKIKYRLKKNFEFFKSKNFRNYAEIKQEYITKIRNILENKTKIKYQFESLPSHNSVKTIIRKKNKFEVKN